MSPLVKLCSRNGSHEIRYFLRSNDDSGSNDDLCAAGFFDFFFIALNPRVE